MKTAQNYPDLSIVIPTFNESKNIIPLTKQLALSLKDIAYEIIFIDDSSDNTPDKLIEVSRSNNHVVFEHRQNKKGLASAVIRGFELARSEYIAVMDADMQHPPAMIKKMLKEMKSADIVIPSRFIPGGDDGGLSTNRKLISFVARWIARIL